MLLIGFKASANENWPCESTHELTISLTQPDNVKPLTLSLPYPILVGDIQTNLHPKDRFIDLVLKKATREPWPYEYQKAQSNKWNLDSLKPWEEGKRLDTISTHVDSQFNLFHRPYTQFKTNALNKVRAIIRAIFVNSSNYDQEIFGIQQKDSPVSSPDWYLRVHLPIRTSPLGDPILLVSAVDHRLAEILVSKGKLNKRILEEDLIKYFDNSEITTFWTYTSEEAQLWRYVLRLNSTKVAAPILQMNSLSLGAENSPWLATCISPLYLDASIDQDRGIFNMPPDTSNAGLINKKDFYIFSLSSGDSISEITVQDKSCASCKKTDLKLKFCSRCRTVAYCSVECQRAHWARHKVRCLVRK